MIGALTEGEGEVIADIDLFEIEIRKRQMDWPWPLQPSGILSLNIDRTPHRHVHERNAQPKLAVTAQAEEV